uniref:Uncharacterized protein n=1 Tax=Zea mays TaxID=4577 RepID=A0A804MVU6_MAIZE
MVESDGLHFVGCDKSQNRMEIVEQIAGFEFLFQMSSSRPPRRGGDRRDSGRGVPCGLCSYLAV